jgi:hypothetical protein
LANHCTETKILIAELEIKEAQTDSILDNPLFPASGPANRSFNGLHPKSKFLASIIPDSDFIWVSFFLAQRPTKADSSNPLRCHSTWRNAGRLNPPFLLLTKIYNRNKTPPLWLF